MTHENIDWRKYLIVFLFTVGLFAVASIVSGFFGDKKIEQLKSIQDKIAIDILSSETEFSLLSELSCESIEESSVLSDELSELGQKLEWGGENLGKDETVSYLKKYYFLLEIKDYLLNKKISERCDTKSAFVLYFYDIDECEECEMQGIVLSALRTKYPEIRVYSFDYGSDLSAVQAMIEIFKVKGEELPALVIDDEVLTGLQELEDLEKIVQDSFDLEEPVDEEATLEEN